MLKFDIALAQLFAIAVANFLMSWAWYSPILFMNPWAKALGIDPGKVSQEEKKRMPALFASGIISSFALSFVMQVFVHSVGAVEFGQGACLGGVAWLGFALTGSLGTMWEGRSSVVILINNGLFLVSYAIFGGVLAVWR